MTNKELKQYWEGKTLGELKGYISDREEVLNNIKELVREESQEMASLDFNSKYYIYTIKDLAESLKSRTKDIQAHEKEMKILKPILDKKVAEGIDEAKIKQYIESNEGIQVLIDTIENDKQDFISKGCKVGVENNKGKVVEIVLPMDEVNKMYETMTNETIDIIKNNCGNTTKVSGLTMNGNRGFDCEIDGYQGSVRISTIVAGGYNIQKAHFRTLVHRY